MKKIDRWTKKQTQANKGANKQHKKKQDNQTQNKQINKQWTIKMPNIQKINRGSETHTTKRTNAWMHVLQFHRQDRVVYLQNR